LSKRFTSKNPSTPQGKRGRLRKKEEFQNHGFVLGSVLSPCVISADILKSDVSKFASKEHFKKSFNIQ
jgi:hypothetical protein